MYLGILAKDLTYFSLLTLNLRKWTEHRFTTKGSWYYLIHCTQLDVAS